MSTDYKAMLESTSNHQPTLSNPVEAVVSGELGCMLVYAARYAHNRKTGAANQVVTAILNNWDILTEGHKKQICEEAKNEATCNFADWARITNVNY